MSNITVYRGIPYSEAISAPTLTGNTNIRAVWSWRKYSRSGDYNIAKSHAITSQTATATLTSAETGILPFSSGFRQLFYVNDTSGLYTLLQDDTVLVAETAGGGNASGALGFYMALGCNTFGVPAVGDLLVGSHTLTAAAYITSIALAAQTAPLGAALTATLYVDGVATAYTASITAGTTTNTTTMSVYLTAGKVVTLKWSSTGLAPNEGSNINATIMLQYA